jgi:hypothetical protein
MRWKVVGVFVLGALLGVGVAFWRFETVTAPCVEAAETGTRVWSTLKDIRLDVADQESWLAGGVEALERIAFPQRYRHAGYNVDTLPLGPEAVSANFKAIRKRLKQQYQVGKRVRLAEKAAACRGAAG